MEKPQGFSNLPEKAEDEFLRRGLLASLQSRKRHKDSRRGWKESMIMGAGIFGAAEFGCALLGSPWTYLPVAVLLGAFVGWLWHRVDAEAFLAAIFGIAFFVAWRVAVLKMNGVTLQDFDWFISLQFGLGALFVGYLGGLYGTVRSLGD